MNTRWLGWISAVTLISVTVWLVLLIWYLATSGPLNTFEQVFALINQNDWKYSLTYLNAGIFTTSVIALMGGLYTYCKRSMPVWSVLGLVFVPVYGTINLVVYISQITLVPALLEAVADPVMADTALLILQQSIQMLPGSTISYFNGLAYAILGIPSIIFGMNLSGKKSQSLRLSGWLLLVNGIVSIFGLIGITVGNHILAFGTLLGGVMFWLFLFPLTYGLLRGQDS